MIGNRQPSTRIAPATGNRTFWLGIGAALVIATAIRFWGLADRELWFDESCTFYAAHHFLDWPADGPDRLQELAHPPYFFLLHLWTRLAGETAWALRSFSALFGCLGVAAIGLVGARMAGRAVGLISALLAALHPLHVYYSQEARVYTGWTFAIVVTVYLLYGAARTSRARWWVLYAMVAWMTVLTHYYTLWWLPGTVSAILIASDRRRFLRQWVVAHAALGLALVPVVWLLIVPLSEGGPKPWLRETWLGYPPALAVPKSLWALLPSGGYPSYLGALTVAAEALSNRIGPAALVVARWGAPAVLAGLTLAFVASPSRPDRAANSPAGNLRDVGHTGTFDRLRVMLFLLCLTLLFLLMTSCYSWTAGQGYVVGRYDLAAWPSLILGVAVMIDSFARRAAATVVQRGLIGAALTAILAACSTATIAGTRMVPVSNDLTDRARRIATIVDPDDLVISLGMYKWFMTYEWHQLGFSAQVISFPPRHDRQLCWYDGPAELADPEQIEGDVADLADRIIRVLGEDRRVWLLAHGEPTGARWQVDQHFFARLRRLAIDVRPKDEELGLAELVWSSLGRSDTPGERD